MTSLRNQVMISEVPASEVPLELLLEADPSPAMIDRYLPRARLFGARLDGRIIGAAAVVEAGPGIVELVNIAVDEKLRGRKIGRLLMEEVILTARDGGNRTILVKTGASGFGQLAFYQKMGFRMVRIVPDHFIRSYNEPIVEYDLVCRDQVELEYRIFTSQECKRAVSIYWKRWIDEHPEHADRGYSLWSFGTGEYQADYLLALVKSGIKTGTSSALELYGADEPIPAVGELSIITYGNGLPGAIIETTEIRIRPFDEIGDREAWLEGEGDRSISYWQDVHAEFFSLQYKQAERTFHRRIPVIYEEFRLLQGKDMLFDFPDTLEEGSGSPGP